MSYKDKRNQYDQFQIKQELNKFINLLQNETKNDPKINLEQTLTKKLSIIMSASQPESSSVDKENSNPSANRSFDTGQKADKSQYHLIKSLLNTGLTGVQLKILEQLKVCIDELFKTIEIKENSCQSFKNQLHIEKQGTDELLAVLMKLDKEEKQLWNNYNVLAEKNQDTIAVNQLFQDENFALREKIVQLEKDNQFMKKLIFHANENYQALEKKCNELQYLHMKSYENTDRKSFKKSSTDNLLKSAKTKKNSHSPSHSYSEIHCSPQKQQFHDIYRKMIVRTLKFKGKKEGFRQ